MLVLGYHAGDKAYTTAGARLTSADGSSGGRVTGNRWEVDGPCAKMMQRSRVETALA